MNHPISPRGGSAVFAKPLVFNYLEVTRSKRSLVDVLIDDGEAITPLGVVDVPLV